MALTQSEDLLSFQPNNHFLSEPMSSENDHPRRLVIKQKLKHLNQEILFRFNVLKSLDFSKDYAKVLRARNDLRHLHKLKNDAFEELTQLSSLS